MKIFSFLILMLGVSFGADACRVLMIDNLNLGKDGKPSVNALKVEADSAKGAKDQWIVSNTPSVGNADSVVLRIDDGTVKVHSGIPEISLKTLNTHYKMADDSQLKFIEKDKKQCSTLEKNMIYFLVMEWFYFG